VCSGDQRGYYFRLVYYPLPSRYSSRSRRPKCISTIHTCHSQSPFSPPRSAVWVNSLWFLSLVISLTSVLQATLLLQWANQYVTVTQSTQPSRYKYSLHKRAPTHGLFTNRVERFISLCWLKRCPLCCTCRCSISLGWPFF
jgi:Family of unknown function (DUF6535)